MAHGTERMGRTTHILMKLQRPTMRPSYHSPGKQIAAHVYARLHSRLAIVVVNLEIVIVSARWCGSAHVAVSCCLRLQICLQKVLPLLIPSSLRKGPRR